MPALECYELSLTATRRYFSETSGRYMVEER
jgi:hypothetical protein